jgi:hypothetical protein
MPYQSFAEAKSEQIFTAHLAVRFQALGCQLHRPAQHQDKSDDGADPL